MPRKKQETDQETIEGATVLTVRQVAAYMKVGREAVFKLLNTGKLKGARIGHDWRILRTEVDRFLLGEGQEEEDGHVDSI